MRGGIVMWIGALVFLVGFIALIMGARLNTIVESGIKDEVEKQVLITPDSGGDSKFVIAEEPYSCFFFNITNAKEVLNGSIPIVKEIEVRFLRTQRKYDFTTDAATYGYREYSSFSPFTPSEYDLPLITLNPVFLALAIGQGGSERGFQSLLTPAVFQQLVPVLTGPKGFLQSYQLAVLPVYLATLLAQCMELPVAPFNETADPSACVQQWGLQDQLAGLRISELANFSLFTGWELGSNVTAPVASSLWSATSNSSLINPVGVERWGTLGTYAAEMHAGNVSATPLYNASLQALIADLPGLDEPQAIVVLDYLATQFNSSSEQNAVYYFQIIKDGLMQNFSSVVAEARTWEDLGVLQFSHSVLTQSLERNNSVMTPAFEFMAFQLDVNRSAPTVQLTLNETRNFLRYFQVDGSVSSFAATLQGVREGRLPPSALDQYSPLGVRQNNVQTFASYLLNYLPVTFVLKGRLELDQVLEDGTHRSNTGMFVKRTVREILHGYEDPLLTFLGQNQSWLGLLGPEIHSEADARAYDLARNKTGRNVLSRTDLNNLGTYKEWEGLSEFDLATSVGAACPSAAWADSEAANCTVWQSPEVVAGKHSRSQMAPFQEDLGASPLAIFVPSFFRNIWFDFAADVVVQGINMRRFTPRPSEFRNEADNAGNPLAQERSRNYRVAVSGFQDLSTVSGMAPIHLGLPKHYINPIEQHKIEGIDAVDWSDTSNIGAFETFLDIEPLTGKVMQGRQRVQVNMKLTAKNFDGLYVDMYTAGDYVMFPIMWAQEGDTISNADAAAFRSSVYDARSLAKSWTVVLIILGMVIMVLGLGALCKGWRVYRVKDANERMPLRASDKKAFI